MAATTSVQQMRVSNNIGTCEYCYNQCACVCVCVASRTTVLLELNGSLQSLMQLLAPAVSDDVKEQTLYLLTELIGAGGNVLQLLTDCNGIAAIASLLPSEQSKLSAHEQRIRLVFEILNQLIAVSGMSSNRIAL
jgi:hypothetical protein